MTRWVLLLLFAVGVVLPAWLVATESGLRLAVETVSPLTGGRVTIEHADGRLVDEFTLTGVTYSDEDATVSIGRATLDLRLSRLLIGRVQAESLDVETLSIVVHDTPDEADADSEPLTVSMPVRLAVERGVLRDFRLQVGDDASAWRLPHAEFRARWRDEWITIGSLQAQTHEAGPVHVTGRLAIKDDLVHFDRHEVSGPGTATVEGVLAAGDRAESDITVEWQDLRVPGAVAGQGPESSSGRLHLAGPWEGYAWDLDADVLAAGTAGDVVARGRADLHSVTFQDVTLNVLDGVVHGRGRLDWAGPLSVDGEVEFESLDPGTRLDGWSGTLGGRSTFRAQWDKRDPQIDFELELVDSQLRGYPITLHALGRTEEGRVSLQEFVFSSGKTQVTGRGGLFPEFSLDAQLTSPDLRAVWTGLSGKAEFKARLDGTPEAPRLRLDGTANAVVYRQNRIEHLEVSALLAPAARSDVRVVLDRVESAIRLNRAELRAVGTRAAHEISLDLEAQNATAALGVAGGERDGAWRGQLRKLSVKHVGGAGWSLEEPAALSLSPGRYALDPACLRAIESRVCVQFSGTPDRQHLAFRTQRFTLQELHPWLAGDWEIDSDVTGTASVSFRGGEISDVRADLRATAGYVSALATRLDFGPAELRIDEAGESLNAHIRLAPASGRIESDIRLGPARSLLDRPMQGDILVSLPDLAWLPLVSPEIASAQGALGARLAVSGTLRQPSLDGRVDVSEGRVRLATPNIEFTDFLAAFESTAAQPLKVSAQAVSGGGTLRLDGSIDALRPKLAGEFRLSGEQVQFFNTPELRAWVSPDLKLTVQGRDLTLTGEIRVPRAEITPQQLDRGGIGPSPDQVIVVEGGEAPREALRISSEVRIVLGDDVRFDGLGLKTQLAGAITAYDEPGRLTRGRGELRFEGGRYKAYGQDLTIETGRLLFDGGPLNDPTIELQAYRQPDENVRVGLRARGKLGAPKFSLYSEPAMSQEEQLSWLILGRSLSETVDGNQRAELTGAAASLGLAGGELIAQQFGTRLGFDQVTLAARPGETAEKARFTIGKYLSPKLFVSYGVGLFQPGHFFQMQYDLGGGFKLSGESGVHQGGDLLYTIER